MKKKCDIKFKEFVGQMKNEIYFFFLWKIHFLIYILRFFHKTKIDHVYIDMSLYKNLYSEKL